MLAPRMLATASAEDDAIEAAGPALSFSDPALRGTDIWWRAWRGFKSGI